MLVHRANPTMQLEEIDYTNNAASLRIRLTWSGAPLVETLRTARAPTLLEINASRALTRLLGHGRRSRTVTRSGARTR